MKTRDPEVYEGEDSPLVSNEAVVAICVAVVVAIVILGVIGLIAYGMWLSPANAHHILGGAAVAVVAVVVLGRTALGMSLT